MPGKEHFEARSDGEYSVQSLLAESGITAQDFERASAFVRAQFDGAWRPIALRADIGSSVTLNDVLLKFSLPPGHYATTVCREYMKADPVQMI